MITRHFAAALLIAFASCAWAADGGFYIGAGYGEAHVEDHPANPSGGGTLNFDAAGRSYRAFLGYRTRATSLVDVAGEATYGDYGRISQTNQGVNMQYQLRGGELAGLLILPAAPFDVYGRVGIVSWSAKTDIGGTTSSRRGTNGLYGLGAGFSVGKVAIRAEYNFYDVSVVDKLKTFTLDLVWRFY